MNDFVSPFSFHLHHSQEAVTSPPHSFISGGKKTQPFQPCISLRVGEVLLSLLDDKIHAVLPSAVRNISYTPVSESEVVDHCPGVDIKIDFFYKKENI